MHQGWTEGMHCVDPAPGVLWLQRDLSSCWKSKSPGLMTVHVALACWQNICQSLGTTLLRGVNPTRHLNRDLNLRSATPCRLGPGAEGGLCHFWRGNGTAYCCLCLALAATRKRVDRQEAQSPVWYAKSRKGLRHDYLEKPLVTRYD